QIPMRHLRGLRRSQIRSTFDHLSGRLRNALDWMEMRPFRAVVLAMCLPAGCASPTEIVLGIDSDLAVGTEIDHVTIAAKAMAMEPGTAGVDLRAPGAPTFPLTLGLRGSGGSAVEVTVTGQLQGADVVTQRARVTFVAGRRLRLRMTLMRR